MPTIDTAARKAASRIYGSIHEFVGWVERSETHHAGREEQMGFASLYPSY
jgi:hypothetical protein